MSCSLTTQGKNFRIREYARGLLGGVKDAIHHGIIRGNSVFFQPEEDIGFSAHRADFDHLIEAEKMRGNAAVNRVGQRRGGRGMIERGERQQLVCLDDHGVADSALFGAASSARGAHAEHLTANHS